MPYLDHASASPLHPAAREVLLAAYDEGWADPVRLHREGRRARALLDAARAQVAGCLGARPDEVSFTSSGTASVHAALLGALAARSRAGRHLVVSAVEHSSVLAVAEHHEASGGTAARVGVSPTGVVDLLALEAAVTSGTALVSVQHANHEVGTCQPVDAVAEICARSGVPLHVDAAQSVGRVPVDVAALGASLLSASAHKWGGPAGVGVLVVRKGTRWRATGPTEERESGRWPGFPALPAIAAAAAALDATAADMATEAPRQAALVDVVRREIPRRVADVEVVGEPVTRLPHLVTFSCLYVDGEALVTELDRRGISVSSGSACTSSSLQPSHVLAAMGVLTHGNVRVSVGRDTTAADVDVLLDAVPEVVAGLRAQGGTAGL
ncbi:MAG TPA: aminotransferase class V-fold PLP-dependent enzyme [Mycobacteriales bacterium]|nr:aminotransferase class V-fold PLP-dependent enzyme [Mycobacteriales bacterium]